MSSMFNKCTSLKELNLKSFYTCEGINTLFMFNSFNKNCNVICKDKHILKELEEFYKKNNYNILASIYNNCNII